MIQKKEIYKKIGGIIVELNEQYQFISENLDTVNDLELELFAANADFLAEHIKVFRRLVNSNTIPAIESPLKAPAPSQSEALIPETIVPQAELPDFSQPKEPIANTAFIETVTPGEEELSEFSMPEFEEPLQKAEEDLSIVSSTEAASAREVQQDTIKTPPTEAAPALTLNEIISAQQIQTTSQFTAPAISDLKSAISLNDKLLFIKELFNGYSLAYSEALDIINRLDSFAAADTFLKKNYAVKNEWSSKTETVDKFYELLERRFTK